MKDRSVSAALQRYRFYHVIDLGDGLETPGYREFVPAQRLVAQILHRTSLRGKRVLDVGCRDGLFCFLAERLGASEVVGIDNDLSVAATEFLIPHFKSQVKMVELNAYDLSPDKLGTFDVVIFAGVLYHLRYPFWALRQIRSVMRDDALLIIETGVVDSWNRHPVLHCPTGGASPYEPTSVTFFNEKGLVDTLATIGFAVHTVEYLIPRRPMRHFVKTFLLDLLPATALRRLLKSPALPHNRAALLCKATTREVDAGIDRYWEATHRVHTTGTF